MIYVTVASLAFAAVCLVFAGVVLNYARGSERQHARERSGLLDRIMHLSGRTWSPPPADNGQNDEPVLVPDYSRGDEAAPGT